MSTSIAKPVHQLTTIDIIKGILLSKGRYCTYRTFKNYSKLPLRSTSVDEYENAVGELVSKSTMRMVTVKPRGARTFSKILLKNADYDLILDDEIKSQVDNATYITNLNDKSPKEITEGMLKAVDEYLDLERRANDTASEATNVNVLH